MAACDLSYPDKLHLAQLPTPLEPLRRLSASLQKINPQAPTIWLKRDDLTGSVTSGNKIRKLEYTLQQVLAAGCDTVITCGGIQSNHCRATALLCAKLGLRCILLLRGEKPAQLSANTLLDALAGAELRFYASRNYSQHLELLLNDCQREQHAAGHKAWIIPIGASDGYGLWGYMECALELQQDIQALGITPSAICHATGSGGTQAGLTLGAFMHGVNTPVYGINVCDDEAYFKQKVADDIRHFYHLNQQQLAAGEFTSADELLSQCSINVIDGYVGKGYAKASAEVLACIRDVASLEGVVFDPVYSGKAFYGLCEEIKNGHFNHTDDIIFIHTGGMFGLFDYQEALQPHISP